MMMVIKNLWLVIFFYPEPGGAYGRVLLFYGGSQLDTFPDWQIVGIPFITHNLGSGVDRIGDYNGDAVYVGTVYYEQGVARNLGNVGDVNGDGINEIIFTTDYPPIVPYPDAYGWVRVMKITEPGLPDSITCKGGDKYILIQWHGKFEENTSHYQILKNTRSGTLGWHQLQIVNPQNPSFYNLLDTAVEFSKNWVRVYDKWGKLDHQDLFLRDKNRLLLKSLLVIRILVVL
ncbi:MAG: hypothetical protein N3A65_05365 [candidate division WOR-3 bacterium]|nr:hypothetical protein [candidate division WOR-3 bacterium]